MADLVKGCPRGAVTAERFSQGMTFDQYAAVNEILSALHERIVVGSPA